MKDGSGVTIGVSHPRCNIKHGGRSSAWLERVVVAHEAGSPNLLGHPKGVRPRIGGVPAEGAPQSAAVIGGRCGGGAVVRGWVPSVMQGGVAQLG